MLILNVAIIIIICTYILFISLVFLHLTAIMESMAEENDQVTNPDQEISQQGSVAMSITTSTTVTETRGSDLFKLGIFNERIISATEIEMSCNHCL